MTIDAAHPIITPPSLLTASHRRGAARPRQPKQDLCGCGYCSGLREARRLLTQQNHPIYVDRESKEHALLEQLVADLPPEGGMASFIADLNRKPG